MRDYNKLIWADGHRGSCASRDDSKPPCNCDKAKRAHDTVRTFLVLLVAIPAGIAGAICAFTFAAETTVLVLAGFFGLLLLGAVIGGIWELASNIVSNGDKV